MTDSLAVPPLQYYAIVRSQIEHEDNLVGQRLSWFVAAQSFLFTAYAITVSNIRPDNHPSPSRIQQSMLIVVPLVALLTCLLLSITIIAGLVAIANLRRLFDSHVPQPAQHSSRRYRDTGTLVCLARQVPSFCPTSLPPHGFI
jgi:hypothetical protein